MPKNVDLTGMVFGRLTAIKVGSYRTFPNGRTVEMWSCHCDCGNERTVQKGNLTTGHTTSCGCSHVEHGFSFVGRRRTEYRIWSGIVQRCTNHKHPSFHHYGGRGITVCEEWRRDFTAFFRDMGLRPSAKHSIERKDNSLGYEPHNCKWATMREQTRNVRDNRYLTFDEKTMCIADWGERVGLCQHVIRSRLRCGWSVERALTTPKLTATRPATRPTTP